MSQTRARPAHTPQSTHIDRQTQQSSSSGAGSAVQDGAKRGPRRAAAAKRRSRARQRPAAAAPRVPAGQSVPAGIQCRPHGRLVRRPGAQRASGGAARSRGARQPLPRGRAAGAGAGRACLPAAWLGSGCVCCAVVAAAAGAAAARRGARRRRKPTHPPPAPVADCRAHCRGLVLALTWKTVLQEGGGPREVYEVCVPARAAAAQRPRWRGCGRTVDRRRSRRRGSRGSGAAPCSSRAAP